MSLGFQNAGCHIIGGIDVNPYAVETHHRNFPECKHKWTAQDIREVTDLSNLGIEPGEIDILIGGPPCQVFSRVGIGKMKQLKWDIEKDHRNFLYKEYVRFLEYYQPLFFVMENVNNLAKKQKVLREIIAELEGCGYKVDYRVLDSSMFGVPQRRLRVFIVGAHERTDCDIEDAAFGVPVFPIQDNRKTVSVGEAISDLPELQPIKIPLKPKSTGPRQTDRPVTYRCNPESSYQEKMRERNGETVWNHLCRAHNEKDLEIFGMLQQGGKYKDLPEEVMRYRVDILDECGSFPVKAAA